MKMKLSHRIALHFMVQKKENVKTIINSFPAIKRQKYINIQEILSPKENKKYIKTIPLLLLRANMMWRDNKIGIIIYCISLIVLGDEV